MKDWKRYFPRRGSLSEPWTGIYTTLANRPEGVTRILQRAGDYPLAWHRGFCLRLPRNKVLIVCKQTI